MMKERNISIGRDMRSGIASKILFIFGFLLFFIYIVFIILSRFTSFGSGGFVTYWMSSGNNDILLAASILCIAAAIFFLFLYRQFSKLAEITEEIQRLCQEEEEET